MADGVSVVRTFEHISETRGPATASYFVIAEVTGVMPTKLRLGDLDIPSELISISPFCKETIIDLTHIHLVEGKQSEPPINKDLSRFILWRGLKVGDRVKCFQVNSGQFYYVLERIEGIM